MTGLHCCMTKTLQVKMKRNSKKIKWKENAHTHTCKHTDRQTDRQTGKQHRLLQRSHSSTRRLYLLLLHSNYCRQFFSYGWVIIVTVTVPVFCLQGMQYRTNKRLTLNALSAAFTTSQNVSIKTYVQNLYIQTGLHQSETFWPFT